MADKLRVLFLCTGNACRSQMAEGLCRHFRAADCEAWSAGIEKHGLNPNAVKVMAEIGIDISRQHSKTVNELAATSFDLVVTVCGHADEHCPVFSGNTRVVHRGFDDPPQLAAASTEAEGLAHYRRVRDELTHFIQQLPVASP